MSGIIISIFFLLILLKIVDIEDWIGSSYTAYWFDLHTSWNSEYNKFTEHPSSYAAAAAKSLQSCLTLYDPLDGNPPG